MLSCEVSECITSDQRRVLFRGRATLDRSDEVQRVFCSSLFGCSHLIVDLRGLVEIDVSFVVNFCAAHRSAEILRIRFSVEGALSDCLADSPLSSGCPFSDHSECRFWRRSEQPVHEGRALSRHVGRPPHLFH